MADTYLITSDVHGSLAAMQLLRQKANHFGIDKLIVCGDLCPPDDSRFKAVLQDFKEVLLVRGNCDSSYAFSQAGLALPPLTRRLGYGNRQVLLTHGDYFPSPYGLDLKPGDIFISGHTHVPKLETNKEGIICINPGSPTYPRTKIGPTYALIEREVISIRELDGDKIIFERYWTFLSDQ